MKVCTKEHVDPTFGVIPVGSLWEDDSPYVGAAKNFKKAPDTDTQEDD
jgi:hypothetical protein